MNHLMQFQRKRAREFLWEQTNRVKSEQFRAWSSRILMGCIVFVVFASGIGVCSIRTHVTTIESQHRDIIENQKEIKKMIEAYGKCGEIVVTPGSNGVVIKQ